MLRPTPMRVLIIVAVMGLMLSGAAISPVFSDSPLQKIENDDPLLQFTGNWTLQEAAEASDGSYSYSSGNPDDVLTLAFEGPLLTVIYVAGPQLGIMAVEVDDTVLRTVSANAATVQYNQYTAFAYLDNGPHTLRLYASGGVIAIDAIITVPAVNPDSAKTADAANPADGRSYDTLAALGEQDSSMTLYRSFADTAASGDYWRQAVNYLANVMGDWDGDGYDTFGTVYEGRFDYTNVTPDVFTNAENESARLELGVDGVAVVGRFDAALPNDCIGVVWAFPDNSALYALSYVCDFATPVVHEQYLGAPLSGDSGPYSFAAGDFDGDGLDSLAVLRGATIVYTNADPSQDEALFNYSQDWVEPFNEGGPATLLVGDWDGDGVDSFGVVVSPDDAAVSYFYRSDQVGSAEDGWQVQVVTGTSRVAVWR